MALHYSVADPWIIWLQYQLHLHAICLNGNLNHHKGRRRHNYLLHLKKKKTIFSLVKIKKGRHCVPLCFRRIGNSWGSSSEWKIFFISLSRSATFSACAVKWQLTKRRDVPNILKPIATPPFVRKALPARVEWESDSGTEINRFKWVNWIC